MRKYKDKILHYTVSAAIVLGLSIVMPVKAACILALFIGAVKEAYDTTRPGSTGFSFGDLAADIAGIITGAILLQITT